MDDREKRFEAFVDALVDALLPRLRPLDRKKAAEIQAIAGSDGRRITSTRLYMSCHEHGGPPKPVVEHIGVIESLYNLCMSLQFLGVDVNTDKIWIDDSIITLKWSLRNGCKHTATIEPIYEVVH